MVLSVEAIIGLVALLVTCPPSALLVYSWVSRRQRSTQGRDSAPQGSQIQKRRGVRSIPEYTIAGISPQDDKSILWNYEVMSLHIESRRHVLTGTHSTNYPNYETRATDQNTAWC